jgi:hypothetical protein
MAQGVPRAAGGHTATMPQWRDDEGRLHREDGPAVIHANGSTKWYRHGVRHREGGPACEYANGTEKWYRNGLRHRDPLEGPAASYPDGRRIYFIDGVRVPPPG